MKRRGRAWLLALGACSTSPDSIYNPKGSGAEPSGATAAGSGSSNGSSNASATSGTGAASTAATSIGATGSGSSGGSTTGSALSGPSAFTATGIMTFPADVSCPGLSETLQVPLMIVATGPIAYPETTYELYSIERSATFHPDAGTVVMFGSPGVTSWSFDLDIILTTPLGAVPTLGTYSPMNSKVQGGVTSAAEVEYDAGNCECGSSNYELTFTSITEVSANCGAGFPCFVAHGTLTDPDVSLSF